MRGPVLPPDDPDPHAQIPTKLPPSPTHPGTHAKCRPTLSLPTLEFQGSPNLSTLICSRDLLSLGAVVECCLGAAAGPRASSCGTLFPTREAGGGRLVCSIVFLEQQPRQRLSRHGPCLDVGAPAAHSARGSKVSCPAQVRLGMQICLDLCQLCAMGDIAARLLLSPYPWIINRPACFLAPFLVLWGLVLNLIMVCSAGACRSAWRAHPEMLLLLTNSPASGGDLGMPAGAQAC